MTKAINPRPLTIPPSALALDSEVRHLQAFGVRQGESLYIKVYDPERGVVANIEEAPGPALSALTTYAQTLREQGERVELKMKFVRTFPN